MIVIKLKEFMKNKEVLDNNESYIEEIFYDLINTALEKNSSDIHIEPKKDFILIRNRVGKNLNVLQKLDTEIYNKLNNFIKLNSHINITENRLPQDGRMDIEIKNQKIDIRVSTIPVVYGEKIVLRLLNRDLYIKDKLELGFLSKDLEKIDRMLKRKSGMILVTGSTRSGKTTTIYSFIRDLIDEKLNIVTIEDPIEYKFDEINQIQVNNKIGLDFENLLKSVLRQDPDIIVLGEIRDLETAKIAIRASITGHLVITTMHTNSSISSITRLIEMDIEPYLLKSSLVGIIHQNLVQKNETDMELVYEILEINDELRSLINKDIDEKLLNSIATDNNLLTVKEKIKSKGSVQVEAY